MRSIRVRLGIASAALLAVLAITPAFAQAASPRWLNSTETAALVGTTNAGFYGKSIALTVSHTGSVLTAGSLGACASVYGEGTITNPTTGAGTLKVSSLTATGCVLSGSQPALSGCTTFVLGTVSTGLPWSGILSLNGSAFNETISNEKLAFTPVGTCSFAGNTMVLEGSPVFTMVNKQAAPEGSSPVCTGTAPTTVQGTYQATEFNNLLDGSKLTFSGSISTWNIGTAKIPSTCTRTGIKSL